MSVLIKGMEMPKSCNNCPICSVSVGWCDALNRNLVHAIGDTGRAEWCPLVEVPTPHGRLIDVNDLLDDICLEDNDYNRDVNEGEIITLENVDRIPTVIEAEGEE